MIKNIYQDHQTEKILWGKAKLIKLIEDKGEDGTFILKDFDLIKEQDEWGNWHKVKRYIPMSKIEVYSTKRYLVEFKESNHFPVGFKKIVPIKYLYKVGIEERPFDEEEYDLEEEPLSDDIEIREYQMTKRDKFLEINGIECF